jgi:hypothetical protein
MLDFLNKVLSKKKQFTPQVNIPQQQSFSPNELKINSVISFHMIGIPELSNKRFKIIDINTYDFSDEHLTHFTLRDPRGDFYYLTMQGEDNHILLKKEVSKDDVDKIFGLEQFMSIFEENEGYELLSNIDDPWIAPKYVMVLNGKKGVFIEGDYRTKDLPKNESDLNELNYYLMLDPSNKFAFEVEIYGNEEAIVFKTVQFDYSVIKNIS